MDGPFGSSDEEAPLEHEAYSWQSASGDSLSDDEERPEFVRKRRKRHRHTRRPQPSPTHQVEHGTY